LIKWLEIYGFGSFEKVVYGGFYNDKKVISSRYFDPILMGPFDRGGHPTEGDFKSVGSLTLPGIGMVFELAIVALGGWLPSLNFVKGS
jgi:hypothetical protein